ncbi:MAG TPA: hypothetical protein VFT72_07920 [Opitutaceae bacterium]|nr:hypothetical protein [Opitutaceae bacterium]
MRKLPLNRGGRIFCLALLWALSVSLARADKHVAVFANADSAYLEARSKDGKITPQSYVFFEGKFTPGFTVDPSLDKCKFETLARKLAVDLAQQSFFPAKDLKSADLLLIVHWGVTSPRRHLGPVETTADLKHINTVNDGITGPWLQNDDMANMINDPDLAFRENLEWDLTLRRVNATRDKFSTDNDAIILGITDDLRAEKDRPFTSTRGQMLQSMLEEDRYFVVIMAFDAKVLGETKKLRRVWISKLSIRSPGVNFGTAIERMGQVGANYFGTSLKGMVVETAKVKKGHVEIGEAIVIEPKSK